MTMLRTSSLQTSGAGISGTSSPPMAVAMPPLPLVTEKERQPPQQQSERPSSKRSLQFNLPVEDMPSAEESTWNATTNDDDDEVFFDFYQSPCVVKASNDAFSFQDYQDFGLLCNETFFGGCNYDSMDDLQQNLESDAENAVVEWTIVFDYEIYYTGDPIPAVDHVETIILEHLSEIIGLNGCLEDDETLGDDNTSIAPAATVSASRAGNYGQGRGQSAYVSRASDIGYRRKAMEYVHDFSEEELSRMAAISSDPSDVLDPDYNACIVPVPSSISSNADCLPVTGAIHLYLNATGADSFFSNPDNRLSVQSGFQRLIRFGMQQGLYISGDTVKHVSFIGTRVYTEGESPPSNNLEGDQAISGDLSATQQGDHRAGIIIGVVGGFVFVILSSVLLAIRKKHNVVAEDDSLAPLQGGNETALSSLPAGAVNEENPYLITKAPLSVTEREDDTKKDTRLSLMALGDTMATTDLDEDDEESQQAVTRTSDGKETRENPPVITNDEDGEANTTGELKIFHDDEESEEEAPRSTGGMIESLLMHRRDAAEQREKIHETANEDVCEAVAPAPLTSGTTEQDARNGE